MVESVVEDVGDLVCLCFVLVVESVPSLYDVSCFSELLELFNVFLFWCVGSFVVEPVTYLIKLSKESLPMRVFHVSSSLTIVIKIGLVVDYVCFKLVFSFLILNDLEVSIEHLHFFVKELC